MVKTFLVDHRPPQPLYPELVSEGREQCYNELTPFKIELWMEGLGWSMVDQKSFDRRDCFVL